MRIGIDIGRVIIGGDGEDTFFSDKFLDTPAVHGSFKAIEDLNRNHDIYLISKCGEMVEIKTDYWLADKWFYYFTGVSRAKTYFVRHRMDKAPVARALGLDVFIDDRQDIIDSMEGIVDTRILFTSWEQTLRDLEGVI